MSRRLTFDSLVTGVIGFDAMKTMRAFAWWCTLPKQMPVRRVPLS